MNRYCIGGLFAGLGRLVLFRACGGKEANVMVSEVVTLV